MSIFFAKDGEKGLNRTSAAHLCNIVNNLVDKINNLDDVTFVNEFVTNILGSQKIQCQVGGTVDDLNSFTTNINKIGFYYGFIAFYRTALKVIEQLEKDTRNVSFETWMDNNGIKLEVPIRTVLPRLSMDDIIAQMSIKDRTEYLTLEATAAVYGKFIHKDSPLMDAKEELHNAIKRPTKIEGRGQEVNIYEYIPSVNVKEFDATFDKLQAEYREVEQALNHMKSDLQKQLSAKNDEIDKKNVELSEDHRKKLEQYSIVRDEVLQKFQSWKEGELKKLANTKFAIPTKYEDFVKELNQVGK